MARKTVADLGVKASKAPAPSEGQTTQTGLHEGAAGEVAATWVPIASLHEWDGNPRKNDHAVLAIAESIKTYGFGAPVVAQEGTGFVIAGHTRIKAARSLGMKSVPVRTIAISEAKARALALADNKLGEIADWDDSALAEAIRELISDGEDVAVAGFDEMAINTLLAERGVNDAAAEWLGMPECVNDDLLAYAQILVSFANEEDRQRFGKLIGQSLSPKTKALWFPKAEVDKVADVAFVATDA